MNKMVGFLTWRSLVHGTLEEGNLICSYMDFIHLKETSNGLALML